MAKGVEVQLYNAAGAVSAGVSVQIAWFDTPNIGDITSVRATHAGITTDASGWLKLNLSNITGLALSEWGFLVIYSADGTDHKLSPVFASKLQITDVTGGVEPSQPGVLAPWVRPADWLALPSTAGLQKFVGLHTVYEAGSNFVALIASGAYTVDWGDGTVINYAAGVKAERDISYSAVPSTTLSTLGYRQTVISVYPQGAGSITSFDITPRHSLRPSTSYGAGWLDIDLSFPNLTALTISPPGTITFHMMQSARIRNAGTVTSFALMFRNSFIGLSSVTVDHAGTSFANMFDGCSSLQTVVLNTASGTNFSSMFLNCSALQTTPLLSTASGTDFSNMFNGCTSLQTIPLLNTVSGANFSWMFGYCRALQTIPLLNTAAGTSFTSMFADCPALQTIPLLNTAAGTSFAGMFSNCIALRAVSALNTGLGTQFNNMFFNCLGLQTVGLLNTILGTDFTGMFKQCFSLKIIPLLNTVAGKNFSSMFSTCLALQTVPLLNTAVGTNFSSMFLNCSALQTIPLLNTILGATFAGMFSYCSALQTLPALNTAAGTDFTDIVTGCGSLKRGAFQGTKQSVSYASCQLSATELNSIYTGLGTAVAGATVTVTGNWGVTTDNTSIATAKGWAVTG